MSAIAQGSSASGKRFPLRLCEVLEKEFRTIHGVRPTAPSWLLDAANVDFAKLIDQLGSSNLGRNTQVVDAIRKKLESEGVAIAQLETGKSDATLLASLNRLLERRDDLY